MHIARWLVTALLAAVFLLAGANHAFGSRAMLANDWRIHGVRDLRPACVRFVGAGELLGIAGLTPPAAAGLGSVMLCALVFLAARSHRPARRGGPAGPGGLRGLRAGSARARLLTAAPRTELPRLTAATQRATAIAHVSMFA
jgi:DoxX-like family